MMHIRDLQENELDCFHKALGNSARENGIGSRFSQDMEILKNAIFNEKHASTLVVEMEKNLIAYLLYSVTQRNFTLHKNPGLYIHSIYVDIPHRRQKIGTRLIEALIKIAKEKDYGRIEFSLLRTNEIGELFLESLSFKEIDFIKPMRLTLTNN
jgi:ribosomal protein S18 acetylase RimI-like enzyme